jgi:predicted RND superfamily exporter protein
VDQTGTLVFAGRVVVAILSTMTVFAVFFVGYRQFGTRVAVAAACFVAP